MDDIKIIELYLSRDETAISEAKHKYECQLMELALNIIPSGEDVDECVSDAYQTAWISIPPKRPTYLLAYLARITRHNCFNLLDYKSSAKCRSITVTLASELEDCIKTSYEGKRWTDSREIAQMISAFLRELTEEQCVIFMRRYWYADSIDAISRKLKISQNKVKSILFRLRNKLRAYLEKEKINI